MKNFIGINVLEASIQRIKDVFDNFSNIYISFSGGKDSSVMFHLVMDEAIKRNKKIGLLFIDLEGQYKLTIDHINEMIKDYKDFIYLYWVCLPIALRNAVSVYQPKWECWNPDESKIWVRRPPETAITDLNYFPFFRRGMEFEEFTPEFAKWYSKGEPTVAFIGIRTDESLNRYRTITTDKKIKWRNKGWTTKLHDSNVYNAYPIYDFRTADIWRYNGKYQKKYNKLYDLMSKAGLSIHQQRICQPYGDDQRKGLWLFHIIEPETWSRIVARVSGANSGSEFVQMTGNASGYIKISKPDGMTWNEFSRSLIESMPPAMKDHYTNKIYKFISWWEDKGWTDINGIRSTGVGCVPDDNDIKDSKGNLLPSWKRVCKMLLKNDYWGKGLSFAQTKDGYFYKKYMERVKLDRDKRRKDNMRKAGYWRGFI